MHINRNAGRFAPGTSGNRSGRPKGAAGLSRIIARETRDGAELVERLLSIARDPKSPTREALTATQALLDRYAGRPMQPSEIELRGGADVRHILALAPAARLQAIDAALASRALPESDEPEPEPEPEHDDEPEQTTAEQENTTDV